MPKGWKTFSIRMDTYAALQDLAEKCKRSIPKMVSYLISEHREELERLLA